MSDPQPPPARIAAIRVALAGVLADDQDLQAAGLKSVDAYPPASVRNGGAWVGFFDDAVEFSPRELHLYTVPVTFVVSLNAQHQRGLQATEPMIDAALAALRAHQGLGIETVMRTEVTRVQQGVWDVGGSQFIGFQITLLIKESFGATYSG